MVNFYDTTDEQRQETTRYSVLINDARRWINTPLIGFMCDNVEYDPDMITVVNDWFDNRPLSFAGYILHERDMWTTDGKQRLGKAEIADHWNYTPPHANGSITQPAGVLDHSQVFHRWPMACRWSEDIQDVRRGDAVYFNDLVARHGPIDPIATHQVLSREHLVR
jgi:hypothetical protein